MISRQSFNLLIWLLLSVQTCVQASSPSELYEADASNTDDSLSLLQIGSKPTQGQSTNDPYAGTAVAALPPHLYKLGLQLLRKEEILNAVVAKTQLESQILAGENVTFHFAEGSGFDGVDGYGLELLEAEGPMINMLDIGGHIGRVSIAAFKQDPNRMRIVVVEPVPVTYFLLRWNLWLNQVPELTESQFQSFPTMPGVLALNNGIATEDGKSVGLCYTHPFTMRARVCDCAVEAEAGIPSNWKKQCYPMVGRNIDYFLELFSNEPIALVKMDCEGCEHDAVPQFSKYLKQTRHRIVRFAGELHEQPNGIEDFACKFKGGEGFHHVCFGKWGNEPKFPQGWFATVPLADRCKQGSRRGSCVRGADKAAGPSADLQGATANLLEDAEAPFTNLFAAGGES